MTFYNCIVSRQALVVIIHSCGRTSLDMPPAMCQTLHFSDGCVKHYIARSVYIATGKQETVKEAQVCNESMKT